MAKKKKKKKDRKRQPVHGQSSSDPVATRGVQRFVKRAKSILAFPAGVATILTLYGALVAQPDIQFFEFRAGARMSPAFTLKNNLSNLAFTMTDTRVAIV